MKRNFLSILVIVMLCAAALACAESIPVSFIFSHMPGEAPGENVIEFWFDMDRMESGSWTILPDLGITAEGNAIFFDVDDLESYSVDESSNCIYWLFNEEKGRGIAFYEPDDFASLDDVRTAENAIELSINSIPAAGFAYYVGEGDDLRYHVDVYFELGDRLINVYTMSTVLEENTYYLNHIVIGHIDGDANNEEAQDNETEESNIPAAEEIASGATGICTANQVNVRTEPSMSASSIGQINKGDALTVLGEEGEWSKIECSKGVGYIKTQYIQLDQ